MLSIAKRCAAPERCGVGAWEARPPQKPLQASSERGHLGLPLPAQEQAKPEVAGGSRGRRFMRGGLADQPVVALVWAGLLPAHP